MNSSTPPNPYVSRGGLKLRHALDAFHLDVRTLTCADLGCSTGGFTDCLLQAGAARVHAVDTAYGELAWKLRNDARVVVTERTNALHAPPPPDGVDLVVADIGWTPQRLVIPAALRWLKPGGQIISLIKPHYEKSDREKSDREKHDREKHDREKHDREKHAPTLAPPPPGPAPANGPALPAVAPAAPIDRPADRRTRSHRAATPRGTTGSHILTHEEAQAETDRVVAELPALGVRVLALTQSPILGGKAAKPGEGNAEWLALLAPAAP